LVGSSNPPFRFGGSSSIGQSSSQHPLSLLARFDFDGPKTSGYLSLVRLQSAPPNGAVAQLVEQSPVRTLPIGFSSRRVARWRTATINYGGRMANHYQDSEESNFEITSKRRKGFPSETQVKRGVRVVHGNKELFEKLGRNDLCPCGLGRSF
jgi:hypothetical protein